MTSTTPGSVVEEAPDWDAAVESMLRYNAATSPGVSVGAVMILVGILLWQVYRIGRKA